MSVGQGGRGVDDGVDVHRYILYNIIINVKGNMNGKKMLLFRNNTLIATTNNIMLYICVYSKNIIYYTRLDPTNRPSLSLLQRVLALNFDRPTRVIYYNIIIKILQKQQKRETSRHAMSQKLRPRKL